jgi:hypothetical protein
MYTNDLYKHMKKEVELCRYQYEVIIDEKTNKRELRLMNSWYVHYPYEGFKDPDKYSELFITGIRQESALADTLIPLQCPTFRRSDSDTFQNCAKMVSPKSLHSLNY